MNDTAFGRQIRRLAALTAISASFVALPAIAPSSPLVDEAAAACKKASVGGSTKCLNTGQFCAMRNQSDYRRAGFKCARGSDGRNRLFKR